MSIFILVIVVIFAIIAPCPMAADYTPGAGAANSESVKVHA